MRNMFTIMLCSFIFTLVSCDTARSYIAYREDNPSCLFVGSLAQEKNGVWVFVDGGRFWGPGDIDFSVIIANRSPNKYKIEYEKTNIISSNGKKYYGKKKHSDEDPDYVMQGGNADIYLSWSALNFSWLESRSMNAPTFVVVIRNMVSDELVEFKFKFRQ